MVCATSNGSDQPAHMRRLIRAFACRLNISLESLIIVYATGQILVFKLVSVAEHSGLSLTRSQLNP